MRGLAKVLVGLCLLLFLTAQSSATPIAEAQGTGGPTQPIQVDFSGLTVEVYKSAQQQQLISSTNPAKIYDTNNPEGIASQFLIKFKGVKLKNVSGHAITCSPRIFAKIASDNSPTKILVGSNLGYVVQGMSGIANGQSVEIPSSELTYIPYSGGIRDVSKGEVIMARTGGAGGKLEITVGNISNAGCGGSNFTSKAPSDNILWPALRVKITHNVSGQQVPFSNTQIKICRPNAANACGAGSPDIGITGSTDANGYLGLALGQQPGGEANYIVSTVAANGQPARTIGTKTLDDFKHYEIEVSTDSGGPDLTLDLGDVTIATKDIFGKALSQTVPATFGMEHMTDIPYVTGVTSPSITIKNIKAKNVGSSAASGTLSLCYDLLGQFEGKTAQAAIANCKKDTGLTVHQIAVSVGAGQTVALPDLVLDVRAFLFDVTQSTSQEILDGFLPFYAVISKTSFVESDTTNNLAKRTKLLTFPLAKVSAVTADGRAPTTSLQLLHRLPKIEDAQGMNGRSMLGQKIDVRSISPNTRDAWPVRYLLFSQNAPKEYIQSRFLASLGYDDESVLAMQVIDITGPQIYEVRLVLPASVVIIEPKAYIDSYSEQNTNYEKGKYFTPNGGEVTIKNAENVEFKAKISNTGQALFAENKTPGFVASSSYKLASANAYWYPPKRVISFVWPQRDQAQTDPPAFSSGGYTKPYTFTFYLPKKCSTPLASVNLCVIGDESTQKIDELLASYEKLIKLPLAKLSSFKGYPPTQLKYIDIVPPLPFFDWVGEYDGPHESDHVRLSIELIEKDVDGAPWAFAHETFHLLDYHNGKPSVSQKYGASIDSQISSESGRNAWDSISFNCAYRSPIAACKAGYRSVDIQQVGSIEAFAEEMSSVCLNPQEAMKRINTNSQWKSKILERLNGFPNSNGVPALPQVASWFKQCTAGISK